MTYFEKLKSIASKNGISQKELSKYYDMPYNSFNNKFRSCETRFNLKDLIKFAEINNLRVALINDNDEIIETLTTNLYIDENKL